VSTFISHDLQSPEEEEMSQNSNNDTAISPQNLMPMNYREKMRKAKENVHEKHRATMANRGPTMWNMTPMLVPEEQIHDEY
jgi:hypothetical protein